MAEWNNEQQAREQIKQMVSDYYKQFKSKKIILKRATVFHMR